MASTGKFAGQVSIITGGASGIGLACAEHLAREGSSVALFDVNEGSLEKATRTVQAAGAPRVIAVRVDVRDPKSVSNGISEVVAKLGRVDVLVQAAGITGKTNVKTENVEVANFQL